jgi:membrane associated rhomboid family serine protease
VALIPLSSDRADRRTFPFVNYALILANVAVFVYEIVQGPQFATCFTTAYALLPADILHDTTHATGCAIAEPFPYLTLITAMFLHASLLHIGGNMIYLWAFGDNVEDRLGHFWYLIFYLFCGLVAGAAQIAFSVFAGETQVFELGASGAIAGVLGAYLVFFPGSKVRTLVFFGLVVLVRLRAFIVIGFFILLQLLDAYVEVVSITNGQASSGGGVAFFAHIGGFFVGLLIGLLVKLFGKRPAPPPSSYSSYQSSGVRTA